MNIMNKLHNIKYYNRYKVHNKNYVQKKNLNDLLEILLIAIDTQNKSMLIFLIDRWDFYHINISIENDHDCIINNSNQLNHINSLIEDAKYIVSYNKE